MLCPYCRSTAIFRVGNALARFWRHLQNRNLYICHGCRSSWSSSTCDPTVPVLKSGRVRIDKKP